MSDLEWVALPGDARLLIQAAAAGAALVGFEGDAAWVDVPARVNGRALIAIGPSAFRGRSALRRVTLPEGLARIGANAFAGCAALAEIDLPDSVTDLGESAFQGCAALARAKLPAGLTDVPDRAFYGCAALAEIDLPDGVTRIGERAFAACRALSRARLPEGLTSIAHNAFAGCPSLRALRLPASLTDVSADAIPRAAMPGGQLFLPAQGLLVRAEVKRDYALPQGTRALAGHALENNESLLNVDFAQGLERVGPFALAACVCLKQAVLPDTVRAVGRGAFLNCQRMTRARLSGGMTEIAEETFRGCQSLSEIELPAGLIRVGDRAFEDCRSLERLALPEGVREVGEHAFFRCAGLARLELPGTLATLGAGALSGCGALRALVLRGRFRPEMTPVLAEARRAVLLAPLEPPEAFPGLWRKRVCLGYAQARAEGVAYTPEAERACLAWMRRHGTSFIPEALRDKGLMHLLADGDCLSLSDVQTLLDRADGPDRDEYQVTLLDYRNRRFGSAAAEALKLW